MDIKLEKLLARNSAADAHDVRQMKKALNRLGYYMPFEDVGILGIPDAGLFAGLKKFQKDHNLPLTAEVRPNDQTMQMLQQELSKKKKGQYICHTVGDSRVREIHAELDGTVRDWEDSPDPAEEINCRCWAEPVEEGLTPFFPELALIPAFKLGRIIKIINKARQQARQKNLTNHGALRSNQRKASSREIQEAIKTAKETGNVIGKIGKYGTLQNQYRGTNGLTVIEETQGRNAGKIITMWWHK